MTEVRTRACPLCGHPASAPQEEISGSVLNALYRRVLSIINAVRNPAFAYFTCQQCALGFFDPMETGDESLYERLQAFDWYYMENKYEYEVAKRFLPEKGPVLEVGAGKAAFAKVVGTERYTGLEFNDKAIDRAKLSGIRLVKQSVQAHAAQNHKYDAVVSFQVLEHVPDPEAFVLGCVQCLRPGGRLIIGVPAADGFAGRAINHILDMPPHHVTHWSGKTLSKLAEQFGLELVAVEYEPVAPYHRHWVRKILWESRLRALLGMRPRLVDRSLAARIFSKMASVLAKFVPISIGGVKGHSVVAIYRKPE